MRNALRKLVELGLIRRSRSVVARFDYVGDDDVVEEEFEVEE